MIAIVLCVCAAVGLAYWLMMAYGAVRAHRVPRLHPPGPAEADWPALAVIVPACNEADEIAPAARSLLAQDYPNLHVVFVDDRSTDATGRILDELAAGDARAKVVHLTELPAGWLGKVHALHAGLQQAGAELALFTDADVQFAPGALRAAVGFLVRNDLDHLAGFPRLKPAGLILGAMLAAFLRQFIVAMRPWKVGDRRSRAFIGVGAFNLVRVRPFRRAGGFEWLRMEVGDDAAVGLMMKRSAARCGVVRMGDWASLYWHRTVAQALRGSEKGWSSVCRFSLLRTAGLAGTMAALELSPLWALLLLGGRALRPAGWCGAATAAVYVLATGIMARWMRQRFWAHELSGLTAPLSATALVRTAVLGRRRGGAMWRGTLYPTEALRAGMRMKFP